MKTNLKILLDSIAQLNAEIDDLQFEIDALRVDATSISSSGFSEHSGGGKNTEAGFTSSVFKLIALEEAMNVKADKLQAQLKRLAKHIELIPNEQYRQILTMRYIKRWTWKSIAKQMNISRMTAWRWHDNAIKELDKTF